MKEGWEYKKLSDVTKITHGKNQKEVLSPNGIYPIYGSGGNIMGYAKEYLCEEGTTILGRKGSINNPMYIPQKFWNVDTAFGISAIGDNDGKFIYYFIKSIDWNKKNTGTTLPSLTQTVVGNVIIPVPPLSEQQSIVDYLDSAFTKIDALKANAEKALNEAKALFQAELSECMKPKKGWEEKKFGEVCYYHKENEIHKGLPYVGMEHIETSSGRLLGYMNSDDVLSTSFKFNKGEVLYGRLRPYLKKVIIAEFDGCCSTEIFPIFSKVVEAGFIKYWFLTDYITNKINATSAGCRMPRGNMNQVKDFVFYFPREMEEQHSIVAHLDALSAKVKRLETIYEQTQKECDALKQSLLRQVFE